jgi:hypothetical protein
LTEIKTEKTLKRERPCWDQYDDDEVSFVSERPAIRRRTFDEAEAIDLT